MKTFSVEQNHIQNLSLKRYELNEGYQNSYEEEVGEYGEYAMEWPEEIDVLSDQILDCIKKWRYSLTFEFIIEELTKLGWAPCLLYDDNGNFAISGEGMQSISPDGVDDCHLSHFVEKDMWKPTIRKALNYYLDNE